MKLSVGKLFALMQNEPILLTIVAILLALGVLDRQDLDAMVEAIGQALIVIGGGYAGRSQAVPRRRSEAEVEAALLQDPPRQ